MGRGGRDQIAHHGAMAKTEIDNEALEDMWRANQGGNAIRRQKQDSEVVFDFGDHRISVEKHLADERAGQLQVIEPYLNAKGTRGEVIIFTKIPKRHAIEGPIELEEVCDIAELEALSKQLDHGEEENPEVKNQSHLRLTRTPPSWKLWLEWRKIQEKRRAEARAAAAKASWRKSETDGKDTKKK